MSALSDKPSGSANSGKPSGFDDTWEKGMTRPLKPVPKFKQGKRESDVVFLNRIENEAQKVIAKAQYEDKYNVSVRQCQGLSSQGPV